MLSPHQARPKSTPKPVSGKTCCPPVATSRITPSSKTSPKLYLNQAFKG